MSVITRLEEVILVTIWRLGKNAYGVRINKEVSKSFKKKYSMGALYFSLDQLYKKGLVSKTTGNPTPERGGRSKTYYRLTPEGKKELKIVREHQKELWEILPDFVCDKW
jgi:DNA-binding PadR family transcriptional regulator